MIAKIYGIIENIQKDSILVNVSGICYEVLMKSIDIQCLSINDSIILYIRHIFREDGQFLFGFQSFADKCWFDALIKIDGLGPKGALSILSTFDIESMVCAIMAQDKEFFTAVSGIGGKTSFKIVTDMRKTIDKINTKIAQNLNPNHIKNNSTLINSTKKIVKRKGEIEKKINLKNKKDLIDEAISALVSLGFKQNEIYQKIYNITIEEENLNVQEIIKEFLKK